MSSSSTKKSGRRAADESTPEPLTGVVSSGPVSADSRAHSQAAQGLQRSVGKLSSAALARMDREMPWFSELPAQERSWIGMVVQAGIKNFVDWYAHPDQNPELRSDVFGNAPKAFAGQISLQRTVAMIRLSIEVVEENVVDVLGAEDAAPVLAAVTRYGREVAFATAEVYARAAEMRGAWDARLEALLVDSVLRGDDDGSVESRASALGWSGDSTVITVVGPLPDSGETAASDEIRQVAGDLGLRVLTAVQGNRLIVIAGGKELKSSDLSRLADAFGDGPVVIGPTVAGLTGVPPSAEAAAAGFRAAAGWPGAPRPVFADDLLPERVLIGDPRAVGQLLHSIHHPLASAGGTLLDTVQTYLDCAGSLEATARGMFVHVNTVRYRLNRASELIGLDVTDARDGYLIRMALTLGRLETHL